MSTNFAGEPRWTISCVKPPPARMVSGTWTPAAPVVARGHQLAPVGVAEHAIADHDDERRVAATVLERVVRDLERVREVGAVGGGARREEALDRPT
ncbi:MAG TPA: hypothetical protein VM513_29630, partial [Kofleriaceae bacterium]|nr:hypothetical protein [Kofleriaceae bacterium]